MEDKEKLECLIVFLNEVTSSQDLGETAAYVMDVDEEQLWEITKFGINVLKQKLIEEK